VKLLHCLGLLAGIILSGACSSPAKLLLDGATPGVDGQIIDAAPTDSVPIDGGACPVAPTAQALAPVANFGANPGNLALQIYVPTNHGAHPPLVLALHGCSQTAAAYAKTGWNRLADYNGFIVAYPQTTANNGCFNWFAANEQTRAGNEVTSIVNMVQALVQAHGVDATRVYVTGLSAGGASTAVLLATHPDVFAAGTAIAGVPFRCAGTVTEGLSCMSSPPNKTAAQWGDLVRAAAGNNLSRVPRLSIWHGSNDNTVNNANALALVAQFTNVNGIDATADKTTTVSAATHREYRNAAGVTLVDYWSVAGMNHGTPVDPTRNCGTAGPFVLDVGLCSSRYAAEFFGLAACATP